MDYSAYGSGVKSWPKSVFELRFGKNNAARAVNNCYISSKGRLGGQAITSLECKAGEHGFKSGQSQFEVRFDKINATRAVK